MAVTVKKLEGEEIPHDLRGDGVTQIFRVTDENGVSHFTDTDEVAAKMAVELSEPAPDKSTPSA